MKLIKKIVKNIFYFFNEIKFRGKINVDKNKSNNLEQIIDENIKVDKIIPIRLPKNDNSYKWDGAINYNQNMYCIANSVNEVLKLNLENDKIKYLNINIPNSEKFKWTGGCKYNNKIYGFPRASNKLLCIDPQNDNISIIDIKLNYKKEHHYAGVCTKDGIIYQPPRGNNTILVINLNDYSTREIKIAPKFLKYRYLSGIQHTNGLIYFFPERNEKVLVLNPKNEKIYMIGKRMKCMVFDAAIGNDDNIYGFSGYERGILKINTKKQDAEMICKNIGIPGCFGSKLSINGKIYGIPGNGKNIWEFDVRRQEAKKIFEIDEDSNAKCAGGIMSKDGSIYAVPALGNTIYKIKFNSNKKLTEEQLNSIYFSDNY